MDETSIQGEITSLEYSPSTPNTSLSWSVHSPLYSTPEINNFFELDIEIITNEYLSSYTPPNIPDILKLDIKILTQRDLDNFGSPKNKYVKLKPVLLKK